MEINVDVVNIFTQERKKTIQVSVLTSDNGCRKKCIMKEDLVIFLNSEGYHGSLRLFKTT